MTPPKGTSLGGEPTRVRVRVSWHWEELSRFTGCCGFACLSPSREWALLRSCDHPHIIKLADENFYVDKATEKCRMASTTTTTTPTTTTPMVV